MRIGTAAASAFLGLASLAPAQPFGFTHRMVPVAFDATQAVALGDVDGDGDLDAFMGNSTLENRLYLNDGTGVLADVTGMSLPTQVEPTRAVALGDVDGDGDLDAFVGNGNPGMGAPGLQNRLYVNGGTGVFADATATSLPAQLGDTEAIALGDVDGDGDLDALVGNYNQPNRLYLNVGTGVFADATATNLPALLDATRDVALGDVDGDGDLDAYLGNSGSYPGGQNRLYLNSGTGVFTNVTATNLPALLGSTSAVALGDVDADGDLDVFVGNGVTCYPLACLLAQNRLYLNIGTGVFTDVTATNLPAQLGNTEAVAFGDVDGDGDLDACVGDSGSFLGAPHRLYLNSGAGGFTDVTATNLPALLGTSTAVALGDMDGDGDLDALAGCSFDEILYLNAGTGIFADATGTILPPLPGWPVAVALGDMDGDGDLDAFVGNGSVEPNQLHLNDGRGMFTDVTVTNLPGGPTGYSFGLALGDVDGDGDLDAYLGREGYDFLYLNGGTGVFVDVTASSLPTLYDDTTSVALGDVDGDGDLDVFVGNTYGEQDRLRLNGGTGIFTDVTPTNLPALNDNTAAVALGDVDADGDLDAFMGDSGFASGQDRLYLNGGTGVFADVSSTSLPALIDDTRAIALADVDGDGDLDAFVGNRWWPDRLYLNGGSGVFTDATAANLPPSPLFPATRAVRLGDLDEDGDLDALTANDGFGPGLPSPSPPPIRLYRNAGPGGFSDDTATELPALIGSAVAVALGDLDGDGDLDAFVGTPIRRVLLDTNLRRQLAWRGLPRAGKPLTLDLWGPANGSWLLAASTGTASIPLPPFGSLRLFPPTLFIVAGGALDPQGRASVTFPVPANPALVGASLYWQAVVGPPFRFTNLEVTTATSL